MEHLLATLMGLVRETMRRHDMVRAGERVLVAVSGGADSVGLLAILHRLRRRLGIELVVAHVNHRLRGEEADADEACAAAAAARLGIPFVREALELGQGSNLEERAREQRYRALQRLARAHGCQKIATGHTQDDQAETVLLRLIRGGGLRGLGGMQARRADGVIRPLLDCRRTDIERLVRQLRLAYRVDRTNYDLHFQRAHVRHRLLPLLSELNPSIARSLAQAAALWSAEAEIAAAWTREQVQGLASGGGLDVGRLLRVPAAWQGCVLRGWLSECGVGLRHLTARHIEAVLRLAAGDRSSGAVVLPGGQMVRRRATHLTVGPARSARIRSAPRALRVGEAVDFGAWRLVAEPGGAAGASPMPTDLWSAVCDADAGLSAFTVRSPMRGERVRPMGLAGTRKLSDIFIDRKVPAEDRFDYPVVECQGAVLWVPGVMRSELLRVGQSTHTVVWLRAERLTEP